MKRLARIVLGAALALVTAAWPAAAADKLNFRLDWTFYGTHAPFYLGIDRGWYRAEGIDLGISEGNGSGNTAKLIAQGNDPVGFMDYGTMTKGVAGGMPLRAVFGVHQRSPMIIISHADAAVRSPKELEGKVIAFAPAESTAQMFPVLMATSGADPAKISVLSPAVGAKAALFLQRRVDAITGSSYFHVPQLESQGAKLHYFGYADFGVTALEGGVVANSDWLARNRELAMRFVRATAKAWQAAIADPGAAIDAAVRLRPELAKTRATHLRQLQMSLENTATPNTKGLPFGRMAEKDWQTMVEQLVQSKQLAEPVPVERLFTNEFVAQ